MLWKKIKGICGGFFCAALLLCTAACGAAADPGTGSGTEPGEKTERPVQGEQTGQSAQTEQGEQTERPEQADQGEQAEQPEQTEQGEQTERSVQAEQGEQAKLGTPVRVPLEYAGQYTIDRYEEGYVLITIADRDRFLVVPEGRTAPVDMDGDIVILQQPLTDIYLAASAVMDMFRCIGGLDAIRLSGTDADGWSMDEVSAAMKAGDILYAGKYNAPDYELILSEGCDLAIENLMIDHSPEVKEELESLGIPVLMDYSSYEQHPLGRAEWVKLYGILLGREDEAQDVFDEQVRLLRAIEEENAAEERKKEQADSRTQGQPDGQAEGRTAAFFFITSNGAVNVRKSSDYVPKMIELAGGRYIFEELGEDDSHSSSLTMQIEEFYAAAKDADYLIYNSTIDGEIRTVDELTDKCSLLEDFKAVQDGNVYCTTKNLYQESMSVGVMIDDLHKMLTGGGQMQYLYRLDR